MGEDFILKFAGTGNLEGAKAVVAIAFAGADVEGFEVESFEVGMEGQPSLLGY